MREPAVEGRVCHEGQKRACSVPGSQLLQYGAFQVSLNGVSNLAVKNFLTGKPIYAPSAKMHTISTSCSSFFFFNQLQVIRASHTSNVKTDIIKSCSQRPKGNENMDGEHLNMVFKKYNQKEEAHHLLAQLI